uniref:Protein TIC 22, chloroplastic n=1 Tax=Kalanchoe fedtschenkoi TaxID=63787 RepID=A0A7N0TQP1_KALFE
MEHPKPYNPLLSLSSNLRQHFLRLTADLTSRIDDARKKLAGPLPGGRSSSPAASALGNAFASLSQEAGRGRHAFDVAMSGESVARTLAGTAVYTVSNSNNEFVLISDPNGLKSIGLLCFRQEDAEAFLAQVRLRKKELRSGAKVVPITLDQVYMLKVEGIAFRFMPDPVQIQNALELKASDARKGFDGVPVFQSDLLVVKKKNKRYCPIYFRKEDIEKELTKVPRRGSSISQHIMVGSLEDVLKKMEMSEKNSGWEDLIFVPPGKSHSQHLQEVAHA